MKKTRKRKVKDAHQKKKDEAGYQSMSERDRWSYDKKHGYLDD